jgi:hypothetical protein
VLARLARQARRKKVGFSTMSCSCAVGTAKSQQASIGVVRPQIVNYKVTSSSVHRFLCPFFVWTVFDAIEFESRKLISEVLWV